MAQYIVMPKLGLTMKEGSLHRWTVEEGDAVAKGQKLFEVETDKLTSDVEAPADGVIRKILLKEGKVPVLTPVAILATAEESIDALLEGAGTGEVAEDKAPEVRVAKADKEQAAPSGGRVKASPKAKRLAKELGVDLQTVEGTGPGGAIAEEDVQRAYEAPAAKEPPKMTPAAKREAEAAGIAPERIAGSGRLYREDVMRAEAQDRWEAFAQPKEERRRISTMRQIIAERMVESQRVAAPVSYQLRVDARGLIRLKEDLSAYRKVSFTDLLVKITARVLLDHPLLNATLEGEELILRDYVNMGVAVALEDGLLVPVIKMAHVKDLATVSTELRTLAEKARLGTLEPDALGGGTFTLTNLGMFEVEGFTPVINQPQAAILGINAISQVPVPCESGVAFVPMLPLSLTADHRIVDGAVAAAFLARLKREIENPAGLVL